MCYGLNICYFNIFYQTITSHNFSQNILSILQGQNKDILFSKMDYRLHFYNLEYRNDCVSGVIITDKQLFGQNLLF
jgi:hypothetical protein